MEIQGTLTEKATGKEIEFIWYPGDEWESEDFILYPSTHKYRVDRETMEEMFGENAMIDWFYDCRG